MADARFPQVSTLMLSWKQSLWSGAIFAFCPAMCQRDLYSFTYKCQGNKTVSYRKCQQHRLTKDIESDSHDKQYFSFPCQDEPCGGASFFIYGGKMTVSSNKLKQMAPLYTESFGYEVTGQINNWIKCTHLYMHTDMQTHAHTCTRWAHLSVQL